MSYVMQIKAPSVCVVLCRFSPVGLRSSHFIVLLRQGDVVGEGSYEGVEKGLMYGSWVIPKDRAGGDYVLRVDHEFDSGKPVMYVLLFGFCFVLSYWGGLEFRAAPGIRKFNIRVFRPPRFNAQLEFAQRGYGPGDTVVASMKAMMPFVVILHIGCESDTGCAAGDARGGRGAGGCARHCQRTPGRRRDFPPGPRCALTTLIAPPELMSCAPGRCRLRALWQSSLRCLPPSPAARARCR
jgi:hypothetical protein